MRTAQLFTGLALLFAVTFLTACGIFDFGNNTETPIASPSSNKPLATLTQPDNGASFVQNERVLVYAITQDTVGILRVDFIADGVVIQTQPLTVASRRFDYLTTWQSAIVGVHSLTVIAYNVSGIASDPATLIVNITRGAVTEAATPTPFVIYVTPTPSLTPPPTPTPKIIFVTPTSPPTPRPTATPIIIVVTPTPKK